MVGVKIVEGDLEILRSCVYMLGGKIVDGDLEILGRGYIYKVRCEILYGDLELAIVELDIRH